MILFVPTNLFSYCTYGEQDFQPTAVLHKYAFFNYCIWFNVIHEKHLQNIYIAILHVIFSCVKVV